jgi:hypothetical protein
MFETLPSPPLEVILIAGRAVLLIGALWVFALAFIRWRRNDERHSQLLQAHLERTFAEVRSLHETMSVMSARIEALSERAESDTRHAPSVGTGAPHRGYDLATRLARNGADLEELVSSCGITRHEAELLLRLHGKGRESLSSPTRMATQERIPEARSAQVELRPDPTPAQQQQTSGRGKRGSLLSVVG